MYQTQRDQIEENAGKLFRMINDVPYGGLHYIEDKYSQKCYNCVSEQKYELRIALESFISWLGDFQ